MEQGRIILAIVLSFLVFLVWDYFFVEKIPPEQNLTEQQSAQTAPPEEKTPDTATTPTTAVVAPQSTAPSTEAIESNENVREIVVETPLYKATISEKGAIITAFTLKNYREGVAPDAPLKALVSPENRLGTLWAGLSEVPGNSLVGYYRADTESETLTVGDEVQKLSFTWRSPQNVLIEKLYVFQPDSYLIDYEVTVKNNSTVPFQDRLAVTLTQDGADAPRRYGFEGPSGFINGQLEQIKSLMKRGTFRVRSTGRRFRTVIL